LRLNLYRFACFQTFRLSRQSFRLHTDDFAFESGFLHGYRNTAEQSAAACRDEYMIEWNFFIHAFQADGAMAGDDQVIFKWRNNRVSMFFSQLLSDYEAVVDSTEFGRRPVLPDGFDFEFRCCFGDDDGRFYAQQF